MQFISPDSLQAAAQEHLDDASTRLAPLTLRNRALTMRRLAEYCEGAGKVDAQTIAAFLNQHPGSTPTRHDAYKRLRTFWAWGVDRDLLPDFYASVPMPGPARKRKKSWPAQIEAMLDRYPQSPLAPVGAEYLTALHFQREDSTMDGYCRALHRLLDGCPETMPTAQDIALCVWGNKLSVSTKSAIYRALKTFWRWGVQRDELPDIWTKDAITPPSPRTIPRALAEDEIDQLLDALPEGSREQVMVATLLDTGIRVGELASLTRSAIRQHTLDVRGKTGSRSVPVSPHIQRMLWDMAGPDGIIWRSLTTGQALTVSGVQNCVCKALRMAGIRPPKAGPHMLRHTFGLNYILAGGDVFSLQAILGHTTVSTTMIYVHMGAVQSAEQHARYSPMAKRLQPEERIPLALLPPA